MPNQKRASVRARGKSLPRTRRSLLTRFRERGGFTLIETIISMGLLLLVLSFALANYYRGGDDSVLNRETSLLMGRIRLAQEETASGQTFKYCDNSSSGKTCTIVSDCPAHVGQACIPTNPITPPGGEAMVFSCPATYVVNNYFYKIIDQAKTHYGQYADHVKCKGTDNTCLPPISHQSNWELEASDGVITYYHFIVGNQLKIGLDAQRALYAVDSKVEIKDIRLTEANGAPHTCATPSPWAGQPSPIPNNGAAVPAWQPLQGVYRFLQPDARKVEISDNIRATAPSGQDWTTLEVMLKLKKRGSDCSVVTMTESAVISQRNDADCDFAT